MVNENLRFHFVFSKNRTNRSKVENMNNMNNIKYYTIIKGQVSGRF